MYKRQERDSLIWRQDCSHILAANYTLFVYVHVPVGTVNSWLRLYEYLETPVRIAGQLMILFPRERMLAVSDDQMRSREVSADYLRGCDRCAGSYYILPQEKCDADRLQDLLLDSSLLPTLQPDANLMSFDGGGSN